MKMKMVNGTCREAAAALVHRASYADASSSSKSLPLAHLPVTFFSRYLFSLMIQLRWQSSQTTGSINKKPMKDLSRC